MAAAVSALSSLGLPEADVGSEEEEEEEEAAEPGPSAAAAAEQRREERLRRFRELHMKRYEACKLNSQEVVEEDKRLKLPPNWEAKKARLEWELQVQEKKKECAARGEDYERVKLLEISAEDAERWERKKKKKNPDLGFSDYAAAQLRQYQRLTRQIKPDLEQYERLKEQYTQNSPSVTASLGQGHCDTTKAAGAVLVTAPEVTLQFWLLPPALAPMAFLWVLVLLALAGPVGGTWDSCRGTCGLRPMASDHSSAVLDYKSMASPVETSPAVGGTGVQPGAWPGIVSIQATWENGTWHMCAGVLLSSQWVLTVAHCFARAGHISKWEVVIGATDLTQLGPESEVRHIQRLQVHQHYVPATARNDIALVELDQPVECSDYIQLGCVPDASLRVSELKSCYIAGWNFARAQGTGMVLQEAKVHLMDTELCNSSPWYAGAVHADNLCAGYPQGSIDTCQGDSGGPLVCKDNGADYYWLVGMNSWGRGCDRARHPGIYTSTQHFYNWILLQTGLSPAERAGPAPEPVATSAPERHVKPEEPEESEEEEESEESEEEEEPEEPEEQINLTPEYSQKPAATSSGTSLPMPFPHQILVQFWNLLQEFLQFMKDKKA